MMDIHEKGLCLSYSINNMQGFKSFLDGSSTVQFEKRQKHAAQTYLKKFTVQNLLINVKVTLRQLNTEIYTFSTHCVSLQRGNWNEVRTHTDGTTVVRSCVEASCLFDSATTKAWKIHQLVKMCDSSASSVGVRFITFSCSL